MGIKQYIIVYSVIFLSALILAAAFIAPFYCAEGVFFFLVPILYCIIKKKMVISGKHGFVWGFIFYIFFFFDIFNLIIDKGAGVYRCFAIIVLLIYGSCTTAWWFATAHFLSIYLCNNKMYGWLLATIGYFFWVEYYFFIIFGVGQGNCLHYLVLPLAARPAWLYFLPVVGKGIFLVSIIISNALIALYVIDSNKHALISLIILILFFSSGWILYKPFPLPEWSKKFGFICADTHETDHLLAAENISKLLNELSVTYPECRYVVMPESTFKFPLNKYKHYLSLWNYNNHILFIGSHRYKKNALYNSIYYISQGSIVNFSDKQHILFFTEYIPKIWRFVPGSQDLFLSQSIPFSAGTEINDFELPQIGRLKPLICSDLFLENSLQENIYLCIVNDSWFSHCYIPNLMHLHATMVAIEKKATLIYSSYHYHCIFNASGSCYTLPGLTEKRA